MLTPTLEQRALLSDVSDDEAQNKLRTEQRSSRGRAHYKIKGAAAIFSQWPEYWSTSLLYLWFALLLIFLALLLIYNSMNSFAKIPTADSKFIQQSVRNDKTTKHIAVYITFLTDIEENANIDKHLPFIRKLSTKYENFKYKLIVLLNNTDEERNSLYNDNVIVMEPKWPNQKFYKTVNIEHNIDIMYIKLLDYLSGSILKNSWKHVSRSTLEFLFRVLSIWENGGISFNPAFFSDTSFILNYQKIEKIMDYYRVTATESTNIVKENKITRRNFPNNIFEIIKAMEIEDQENNENEQNLTAAENQFNYSTSFSHNLTKEKIHYYSEKHKKHEIYPVNGKNTSGLKNNGTFKKSATSMYLPPIYQQNIKLGEKASNTTFKSKPLSLLTKTRMLSKLKKSKHDVTYQKMYEIDHTKDKNRNKRQNNVNHNEDGSDILFVEMKGNILATQTACHAFLGNLLSDLTYNSNDENLTDLILRELSIFCKGVLSKCHGIQLVY